METPATLPRPAFRLAGSTLRRIRGSEFAQNCQHASTAIGDEAAEVGAIKWTAAEPDAIRARYPRTFGDVLGVPAPDRYGAVCR